MRQSLMAWFFMGALALAAFDAFEAIYSDPAPTASSEISTDAVMTGAREGTSPPPAGQ